LKFVEVIGSVADWVDVINPARAADGTQKAAAAVQRTAATRVWIDMGDLSLIASQRKRSRPGAFFGADPVPRSIHPCPAAPKRAAVEEGSSGWLKYDP
jgi:hypothetical protein